MNRKQAKRFRASRWLGLALALGAGCAEAGVVTTLADGGPGSLREQVAAGGTVTFAPGLSGTITLTLGSIAVPGNVTITGPGANVLVVNGNGDQIFTVSGPATISGLTLTGGVAERGGAIQNAGALILDSVAIASNTARDAGGGVYNTGSLTIRASTLSGNSVILPTCAGGGAIRSEGPGSSLVVVNTTIHDNSAPNCNGGGISFNDGSATIRASTITANSAGLGGGNIYKGSASVHLTLAGTVVSDGTAGGGTPANDDLHGAIDGLMSMGFNLVRARGDSTGYASTDLPGGTDPLLGPLGDRGGPTRTRVPSYASPLIDHGALCEPTDQRGFERPQGAACDVGATEYRLSALTATIVGSGTVSAAPTPVPLAGGIDACSDSCSATYDGEAMPVVTLTASPAPQQRFIGWAGDCAGASLTTTITMSGPRTCVARFEQDTFTVVSSVDGGNGTIDPAGPATALIGAQLVYSLSPAANHHVASVDGTCGGTLSGPGNSVFTTSPITADCTVIARFAIDQHMVTPSVAGGNGTISPSAPVAVDHGSSTTFTLTPAANHHVDGVDGTCGGTLSGPGNTVFTTNAVTTDCTVVARFAIDRHTVTPSVVGGNGTIAPSAAFDVDHGTTAVFMLTPAANHHVDHVDGSCGGTLSGPGNTIYTTNAVTADCTVVAHFAIDQHTVTPSVGGGNGTISPATAVQVDHGSTTTFTLTPAANHHVDRVDGTCGGTLSGPGNTVYTTNAITADCTVVAHFAIDRYTVTPSVDGGNGTISPATPVEVDHGATTTFTLAPAANHHVDHVDGTCGGTLSGPGNTTYTTAAITADCTVIAHFAIDRHTVTPSADGNGTISPATPVDVDHGATTTFTLTPAPNHHVDHVDGTCGGTLSGEDNTTYTTDAITADCTVVAHFAIDRYTVTPGVDGGNGTISPATPVEVDHGSTTTFTLAPAPHYHVDRVDGSCGGSLSGADDTTYTTDAVTADCTVVAHFAIDRLTVGGTVSGLVGSAMVLRLNGTQSLLVSGNGPFTFPQPVDDLTAYTVAIAQQPIGPTQVCTVSNGSGTLDGSDVTNVLIDCPAPQPHLVLSVSDGRDYARYGMILDYVVTLHNDGNGDAEDISIAAQPNTQLDDGETRWICRGAGDGASCTASGSGALADTNVSLPVGRSLTWIVSAPVRLDAPGAGVDYRVEASGSDADDDATTLVLLRTGMDVPYGDGAEGDGSAASPFACRSRDANGERFDLAAARVITLPFARGATPIDVVLAAGDRSGFRVERYNGADGPLLRVVTIDAIGRERAGDWMAAQPGSELALAIEAGADGAVLLLEGDGLSTEVKLPAGVDGSVRVRRSIQACD